MDLRAIALISTSFLAACATVAPKTPYEEGEQVVIAIHACIPSWIPLSPRPIPQNGQAMLAVRVAPSTLDLERDEVACVLAAAGDCGDVRNCFGIELFADERCASIVAGCEGDTVVTCSPGDPRSSRPAVRARQDCRHEGRVCDLMRGSRCAEACGTPTPTCDGDDAFVETCGTTVHRVECDPGTACVAGACRGTGAACMRTECVDGALVVCDLVSHAVMRSIHCEEQGARCVSDGLGAACTPRAADCNASTPPSCVGPELRYCGLGGAFVQYDCVAHGLGPCEVSSLDGQSNCGPAGRRLF